MKILKSICALTVLTSLFVGLAPQSGVCQMTQVRMFACAMPCCKMPVKAASCPMIRPEAPRDVIGTSSLKVSPALQVIATLAFRDFVAPVRRSAVFDPRLQIPKIDVCSTPQSVPAPPVLA